ncbi:hypothetical protein TNCV_3561641 [Trichonephila clavipes]|nr:hypothetical protein TNCV_3561641 [Trichonephila clavipes]
MPLVLVVGNLIKQHYIYKILRPVAVPLLRGLVCGIVIFNKIVHVVSYPTSIHVIDCCRRQRVFQISYPLKISGHGLLRDWDTTDLQSLKFMQNTKDFKLHKITYSYLSSKLNFTGWITGDEAHFWLNGYVNKQNCCIWSEANPQVYVETPLHPEKLTVWGVLWAGGILLQKR